MKRQKQCIYLLALLLSARALYAQEQTATEAVNPTAAAEPILENESVAEAPKLTKQQKQEAKQLEQEKKKAEKAEKKRKKNERTDPYLGVVYLPVRNYDVKRDGVQISLRGGTGSFNIAAINEKGICVPVLSGVDDASSSYFSVLIDGVEYRLNHDAGSTPEVRELDASGQLAYTVDTLLQVAIDFAPIASVPDGKNDMVRLTVYTTNRTKKTQSVSIKALFDTILGENTDYHFYTANGVKIDSARQFFTPAEDRWIASSNGKTTAQFLLSGRAIAEPEAITVANRDELYRARWIPVIKQHNGFNGVLAYNNSALMLSWPAFTLEPEKTETLTLYIALASDGAAPQGDAFLDNATVDEKKNDENVTVTDNNGFVVRKPDVEFIVPPITDKQLDPAYIQQLIDRIDNLQSDPKLVDRTEVRQLNAELDAILEKIRQQR